MANIKKDEVKDTTSTKDQVLLTEAEFEKKQRLKAKERINRVTRVFGVFTILLLTFAGVFEPLFEISYFGRLFTPEAHKSGWDFFMMDNINGETVSPLFDDWLDFGPWLAKIGVTALLIGAAVLLIYFLTYTIVDLVDLVKELINAGKEITHDLSGNVKDTMGLPEKSVEPKPKKKKKSLFDSIGDKVESATEKSSNKKRRSERTDGFGDLTSEQLDALLSGKPMEEVLGIEENTEEKSLF